MRIFQQIQLRHLVAPRTAGNCAEVKKLRKRLKSVKQEKKYRTSHGTQHGMGTILHTAAYKADLETIKRLLELFTIKEILYVITSEDSYGDTVLHIAVYKRDIDTIRYLIKRLSLTQRYDLLLVRDHRCRTALHCAVLNRDLAVVQCLLELLTPNQTLDLLSAKDNVGRTALHLATLCGFRELVRYLVKSLIPNQKYKLLQIRDQKNETALWYAAYRKDADIVNCLLHSLSLDQKNNILKIPGRKSYTPLHLAACRGDVKTANCLLKPFAPDVRYELLEIQDHHGRTVLHCAARFSSKEIVTKILLHLTPEQLIHLLEIQTTDGENAQNYAAESIENVAYLQECRLQAEINQNKQFQGSNEDGALLSTPEQAIDDSDDVNGEHISAGIILTTEEQNERGNVGGFGIIEEEIKGVAAKVCGDKKDDHITPDVMCQAATVDQEGKPKNIEEDDSLESGQGNDYKNDDPLYEVRDILKGEVVCHAVKYSPERAAAVFCLEYEEVLKYQDPKTRLISYLNFNSKVRIPSYEFSEAGFFSANIGDEVICAWCMLGLKDFVEPVDPFAIHQMHSYKVDCGFFKKRTRQTPTSTFYTFTSAFTFTATKPSAGVGNESALVTTNPGNVELDQIADLSEFNRMSEQERYTTLVTPRRKERKKDVTKVEYLLALSDLKYEISRRETFSRSALINPTTANRLAADGFFLCKNKISCTFCSHSYEVYEAVDSLDDVLTRHHKNSSSGNRACLEREGNIPYVLKKQCYAGIVKPIDTQASETSQLAQLGVVVELSKHSDFAVDSRRTATFLTYPYHSATSSRTQEFVEAGYFYTGEGDAVTCFSCGATSSRWEPEEGVWQRHARNSTRCQFVLSQKGADFIEQTIETFGEYHAPRIENKINIVTTRTLRPRWDSNVVQGALDLRLEREKVKTVVNNRIMKGEDDFVLMADIVREVTELPKPDQDLTPSHIVELPGVSHHPQSEVVRNPKPNRIPDLEEEEEQEPAIEETTDNTRMEESNDNDQEDGPESSPETFRQIASQLTCKICLSSTVGIIFLPCGHLVCCTSCAAALLQCPMCRSDVRGTIKVNL